MNKLPEFFHDADENEVRYDGSPVVWRVSAYALVIKERSLLVIKDRTEKLHDIPGGGIEIGELVEEGLLRECVEEAGAEVSIKKLQYIYQDYFYYRKKKQFCQTLQLFYICELKGELKKPTERGITFVQFIPFAHLDSYLLPQTVRQALAGVI